jgi:hypothetical protein
MNIYLLFILFTLRIKIKISLKFFYGGGGEKIKCQVILPLLRHTAPSNFKGRGRQSIVI